MREFVVDSSISEQTVFLCSFQHGVDTANLIEHMAFLEVLSKRLIQDCSAHCSVAQWLRCCVTNRKVAGSIPMWTNYTIQ